MYAEHRSISPPSESPDFPRRHGLWSGRGRLWSGSGPPWVRCVRCGAGRVGPCPDVTTGQSRKRRDGGGPADRAAGSVTPHSTAATAGGRPGETAAAGTAGPTSSVRLPQTTGPPDHRSNSPSDHQTIRPSDNRTIIPPAHLRRGHSYHGDRRADSPGNQCLIFTADRRPPSVRLTSDNIPPSQPAGRPATLGSCDSGPVSAGQTCPTETVRTTGPTEPGPTGPGPTGPGPTVTPAALLLFRVPAWNGVGRHHGNTGD